MIEPASSSGYRAFDMVHSLLEEQRKAELGLVERRESGRTKYEYIQLLAPFDGQQMPAQSDFQPVRCQDLSPSGFSFYAESTQTAPYVVIAMGAVPFTFFVAKIARQSVVNDADSEADKMSILVGCEFERRIA